VKAVLLAAGLGTRLRDSIGDLPKILAPLAGRTLLDCQLDYLAGQGIAEVAVNLHHRADAVVAHLERDAPPPLPVRLSVEEELLGTAGALVPLADFLEGPFVLLYGDVLTDLDLGALVSRHTGLATLACYPSADLAGKGVLEVDDRLRVTSFVEKGERRPREGLVNAGIHVLDPAILGFVTAPPCDFGADVWPAALGAGAEITAAPIDAYLLDVGSPEALAAAQRDLEAGRL
jgi:NDP-sugar pyrophosphorylase family protein